MRFDCVFLLFSAVSALQVGDLFRTQVSVDSAAANALVQLQLISMCYCSPTFASCPCSLARPFPRTTDIYMLHTWRIAASSVIGEQLLIYCVFHLCSGCPAWNVSMLSATCPTDWQVCAYPDRINIYSPAITWTSSGQSSGLRFCDFCSSSNYCKFTPVAT